MHEAGIALAIHQAARAEVERCRGGRLEQVVVAVGELSGVEPRLLEYAWEATVAGGADSGAGLEVRWCPSRRRCEACGEDRPVSQGDWLPRCPECGGPLIVEGGRELDLLEIRYEEPDEQGASCSAAQHGRPRS